MELNKSKLTDAHLVDYGADTAEPTTLAFFEHMGSSSFESVCKLTWNESRASFLVISYPDLKPHIHYLHLY